MTKASQGRAERLYAFRCGIEVVDWGLLDASRTGTGQLELPHFRFVILHGDGVVMMDTGGHPVMATNPTARVSAEDVGDYDLTLPPHELLRPQLNEIGLAPSDVHDVVISHLHWDHAGGLSELPQARVHVQRAEHDFAHRPDAAQRTAYIARDFAATRRWHLVDGDYDLFGDGSIVMVSTPGHTPGHQSLLVRLKHSTLLIMGDAAYDREMMQLGRLPNFGWDMQVLQRSWRRITSLSREVGAELVFPHDRHYLSTMRIGPLAYYD